LELKLLKLLKFYNVVAILVSRYGSECWILITKRQTNRTNRVEQSRDVLLDSSSGIRLY